MNNSLSAVQHEENPSTLTSKDFYIKGNVFFGNLEIIDVGENATDQVNREVMTSKTSTIFKARQLVR